MDTLQTSHVSDPKNMKQWFGYIAEVHQRFHPHPINSKKELTNEHILDIYYLRKDLSKGTFFLLKQNQFVPLENLDEKLAEYKQKKKEHKQKRNSPGFRDSFAFQLDFRVMSLLKEYQPVIKFLDKHHNYNLHCNMRELGADMLRLILLQEREKWDDGSLKILDEYAGLFESHKKLPPTKIPPGESPFFAYIKSRLPEPIPAEEPRNMPEQDYSTKLMLESPEFQKKISDATKAGRELWQGILGNYETDIEPPKNIIPDEPDNVIGYLPAIKINDKKPVVKITNQADLLKALGVNTAESLGGLENQALPVAKEEAPVIEAKSLEAQIRELDELRCSCDDKKIREHIPGGDTYTCKSEEMYKNCAYKGKRFINPKWDPLCNLEATYNQMKQAKK
jgi:hypothetical protein